MSYLIYDLVLLVILVLFALWGMHRGLILSLFSLIAVVVAFVGAALVTNLLAPSVAGWVQPSLQPTVSAAIQAALPEDAANAELPLDELLALLDEADLPFGLDRFLAGLREEGVPALTAGSVVESLAASLAEKLAIAISHSLLFLLSFLIILLLWYFLGRTLDLVARLPGLHMLNKAGGLALGVLQGGILLFVCAWVVRQLWSSLIPPEAVEQTGLLRFFMTVNPMDLLANFKVSKN